MSKPYFTAARQAGPASGGITYSPFICANVAASIMPPFYTCLPFQSITSPSAYVCLPLAGACHGSIFSGRLNNLLRGGGHETAGDALDENLGVGGDEDGHDKSSFVAF